MHVIQILREKGREVVSLSSENTLSEAVHLLTRKRIGAVVVRDGQGAIAGILSERDIVRAVAEEGADALSRTVNAYMTRAVATCTEFETVEDLMKMMTKGHFRHVPVLDGNHLCGIVSIGDVVKAYIEETTREAAAMREYIAAPS